MDKYEKIQQVAYLNADNVERYRRIMRFFYTQNQRMNNLLYKEDILEGVRDLGLKNYSVDQLESDLDSLTEWGNLKAQQEMSHPKTIEEYRNKHFRYRISTVGIAIEEFIQSLSAEDENTGDLDSHLFERLLEILNTLDSLDNQALLDGWSDLNDRFDKIRRNATGYITYLTSSKVENLMQTTEFLAYKFKFINYLREFIRKMQKTSVAIDEALTQVSSETIEKIATLQISHESDKPNLSEFDSTEITKQVTETWKHICNWFIDQEGRESEYTNLIEQTNEALSRITRIIQTITESSQQHRSRSKDYLQIANWFQTIVDNPEDSQQQLDEASKLSSLLFGFDKAKHVQAVNMNLTNQLDDLWKMEMPVSELTSKSRKNRARVINKPFTKDSKRQEEVQKKYLEEQKKQRSLWVEYLQNGSLRLSSNPHLPTQIRHELMRYLMSALVANDHRVNTNLGWAFEVKIDDKKSVTVEFDDGKLTMPDMEFKIVGGQNFEK